VKTLVFKVKAVAPGDLIIINACAPRGGKSSAKYKVKGKTMRPIMNGDGDVIGTEPNPPDTPHSVCLALQQDAKLSFMPEAVDIAVKDDQLIFRCTGPYSDVNFSSEVHGEGGSEVECMEF